MKTLKFLYLFVCVAHQFSNAQSLPINELHKLNRGTSQITEDEFDSAIDLVAGSLRPYVEGQGATLNVVKNWQSSTVNAFAQQTGKVWKIEVHGGIARDPFMTLDGLKFILCHEFGHHLAGFPFYPGMKGGIADEGQADYFAGFVCTRSLWKEEAENNAKFSSVVKGYSKEQCDGQWSLKTEQDLCYRIVMASKPLAAITALVYQSPEPQPELHDATQVEQTNDMHPDGQCRLDTAAHGASCNAEYNSNIIPGKNHPSGMQSLGAEESAAKVSCLKSSDYTRGLRPACWFKARIP